MVSASRSYVTRLFEVDTDFKNVFTLIKFLFFILMHSFPYFLRICNAYFSCKLRGAFCCLVKLRSYTEWDISRASEKIWYSPMRTKPQKVFQIPYVAALVLPLSDATRALEQHKWRHTPFLIALVVNKLSVFYLFLW